MKILISLVFTIAILSISNVSHAQTAEPMATPQMDTVPMDGMEVPMDVLMYAQMKYQGYAAVKAVKELRNNVEVIKLIADRDDDPSNYDEKHLFFDTKWKLLEEKDIQPPAPVQPPKPEVKDTDKKEEPKPSKPAPAAKPEESTPVKPEPIEQPAEQKPPATPSAPPEEESTDSSEEASTTETQTTAQNS